MNRKNPNTYTIFIISDTEFKKNPPADPGRGAT